MKHILNKKERAKSKSEKKPQRKQGKRKLRLNPAHKDGSLFPVDTLTSAAGTLLVSCALSGATFHEKVLIASFIPFLLKMLRSGSKAKLEEIAERLYAEGVPTGEEPLPDASPTGEDVPSPQVVQPKEGL